MKYEVVLGFGSNLGNRDENIKKSIELCSFVKINTVSNFIETPALLPENSPESWNIPYLNCAISGLVSIDPFELLKKIKIIEQKLGRKSAYPRWSPRVIDIDILFYDKFRIMTSEVIIPHPEVFRRDFALKPASECASNIVEYFQINEIM